MSAGAPLPGLATVTVDLVARRYEVAIGEGAAQSLAGLVARRFDRARHAAVVTDETVGALGWFASIDPGIPFDVHRIPAGERAKTLGTVEQLCRAFAQRGLARTDVVVAVGGGVVSDTAGFAAAIYHRGIGYCTVASTLLGQVDAAVGGKTGVDLPEGKNLVGAFWQPGGVICDTVHLETLDEREWACGRGEVAKYALLIAGASGDDDAAVALADAPIGEQVARCVELKALVVADDEREAGRRAVLNYGHTLAHALEAASLAKGGDLRHGEAVAVGLVYAALLARRLGRIDDDRVALHRTVVRRFGLSGHLGDLDPEELVTYMKRDKKAGHDLTFVLDGPRGIEVVPGVGEPDAVAALEELACTS